MLEKILNLPCSTITDVHRSGSVLENKIYADKINATKLLWEKKLAGVEDLDDLTRSKKVTGQHLTRSKKNEENQCSLD